MWANSFLFGGRGGMNKRSAFVVVDRRKDLDKFVSVQSQLERAIEAFEVQRRTP
jgi:hypothetical protein